MTNGSNLQKRVLFFGTPEFTISTLQALLGADYEVIGIVTQPDRPTRRSQKIIASPLRLFAEKRGLSIYQPTTLRDGIFLQTLKDLAPDVCVVIAYGKIFPVEYLAIPPLGFVNVHYSLLPAYRGPSPLQTAIINGDRKSGVTVAILDKSVDSGPILAQEHLPILTDKYYEDALLDYTTHGDKLLIQTLSKYLKSEIAPQPQDNSKETFCKLMTRQDARINWDQPVDEIYNLIRALSQEPGTWTAWNSKTLRILKAFPSSNHTLPVQAFGLAGTVFKSDRALAVHTGTTPLILSQVQLEGSKPMDASAFLHGHPQIVDAVLK